MLILPCAPDCADLLSFVLPYEKLAVGLVSRALRGDSRFFLVQDGGKTTDAFSFSKSGQILHCLPNAYTERRGALLQALTDFFSVQEQCELFNIVGEEKGTNVIKTAIQMALDRTTRHEQTYLLLEEKSSAPQSQTTEPLTVVQCTPQMCDALLPLQCAYEREEVLWTGERFDQNVTRLSFQRALRTQQIFALAKNGAYIAKGGTNALGKKYAQLGGMYTVPGERGNGYATQLVRHIVATLRAQGKKSVLFAKPDNAPALRLYEKCGFVRIGNWRIAYY